MLRLYKNQIVLIFAPLMLPTLAFAFFVSNKKATLEKLTDYNLCHQLKHNPIMCHQALVDWVEKNPSDAYQAGKMTVLKMAPWSAVLFFAAAWKSTEPYCGDADVKRATLSALELNETNQEISDFATKIALQWCEKEMIEDVVKLVKTSNAALNNTCTHLLHKNLLTGVSKTRCIKRIQK